MALMQLSSSITFAKIAHGEWSALGRWRGRAICAGTDSLGTLDQEISDLGGNRAAGPITTLKNILELGAADTNSLREVGMPKTPPSHFVTKGDSNPDRSHAPAPAKNVRYGDC